MRTTIATALVAVALLPTPEATAQGGAATTAATRAVVAPAPFGPGEMTRYRVTYGILGRRGTAVTEVMRLDTVRGHPTYHLAFRLKGGVMGLNIDDRQESWLDVAQLFSHRFKQDLDQPRYERLRTLDFYPREGVWRRVEKPDSGKLATDRPLDDVSFLFWSRTLPLEVGKTYTFDRYYKDEGNPVVLKVLRREVVTVPAGTFNTIVVKPLIRTSGLFSEGGEAEVYYSDDWRRLIVLVKTKVTFGSMQLQLESHEAGQVLGRVPNVGPNRQ
jgi:hypothetical protein